MEAQRVGRECDPGGGFFGRPLRGPGGGGSEASVGAAENMLFLKSLRRLRAVRKSKSGLAATENPPQSKILRRCDPEATKQDRKR